MQSNIFWNYWNIWLESIVKMASKSKKDDKNEKEIEVIQLNQVFSMKNVVIIIDNNLNKCYRTRHIIDINTK